MGVLLIYVMLVMIIREFSQYVCYESISNICNRRRVPGSHYRVNIPRLCQHVILRLLRSTLHNHIFRCFVRLVYLPALHLD